MQTTLDLFQEKPPHQPAETPEEPRDYLQQLAEEAYRIFRQSYDRLNPDRTLFRSAVDKVMLRVPDRLHDQVRLDREIRKEISSRLSKIMLGNRRKATAAGKQPKEHAVGDKLSFDEVLLVDQAGTTALGAPTIKGASVAAEIKEIGREAKVLVVHYKQKSKYFKKYGHRQPFFKVAISAINA